MSDESKRILYRAVSEAHIVGAEAPAFIRMLDELNALIKGEQPKDEAVKAAE